MAFPQHCAFQCTVVKLEKIHSNMWGSAGNLLWMCPGDEGFSHLFFARACDSELPESADADSEGERWEFGVFESREVKLYFNFMS